MPRVRALDTLDRRVVIPANAGISGANLNEHRVRLTRKILGQAQDDGEAVPTGSRGRPRAKPGTTVNHPDRLTWKIPGQARDDGKAVPTRHPGERRDLDAQRPG